MHVWVCRDDDDDDTVEKLDLREIKKMNAKQLKDYLKERGLSLQGQKKELADRLIAFETGESSG